MKKLSHEAAEKKSRRAEAKQLSKALKKLDRDLFALGSDLLRREKKAIAALAAIRRANATTAKRAGKAIHREKIAILRRLEILNGRGL